MSNRTPKMNLAETVDFILANCTEAPSPAGLEKPCLNTHYKHTTSSGQIQISFQGQLVYAHRLVWCHANGAPPYNDRMKGRFVWRACGNTRCMEISHLQEGNRADHWKFLVKNTSMASGGKPNHKMQPEQVLEIRRRFDSGERLADLGREFGLHPTTISHIGKRVTWKNLPEET